MYILSKIALWSRSSFSKDLSLTKLAPCLVWHMRSFPSKHLIRPWTRPKCLQFQIFKELAVCFKFLFRSVLSLPNVKSIFQALWTTDVIEMSSVHIFRERKGLPTVLDSRSVTCRRREWSDSSMSKCLIVALWKNRSHCRHATMQSRLSLMKVFPLCRLHQVKLFPLKPKSIAPTVSINSCKKSHFFQRVLPPSFSVPFRISFKSPFSSQGILESETLSVILS